MKHIVTKVIAILVSTAALVGGVLLFRQHRKKHSNYACNDNPYY